MTAKPSLSFWQIWNMCFGFLGIQFGFALQNSNVSRIFSTLGASVDDIPILWIAAPLTGLIVQPLIGYYSDHTWTRLGRRRPYFLIGAILTTLALIAMPNSSALWIAAGLLWIMDASINVSMEPFRAFVGDQLPTAQRPTGYAMQSFFIGVGSVVAGLLPYLLTQLGVSNTAPPGMIPDTVKYAFYTGALVLFAAVGWTIASTREYPPQALAAFDDAPPLATAPMSHSRVCRTGLIWTLLGLLALGAVYFAEVDEQLYLLAGGILAYGLIQIAVSFSRSQNLFVQIVGDLHAMPLTMRQLAVVQFFSWFAMFAMWIYTTGAVTEVHFFTKNTSSAAYNAGANWVGVLFSVYNGVAALAALVIAWMTRRIGLRLSHLINLSLGGVGLLSFLLIHDPRWLLASMIGVGFAWASILSIPYALLSDSVPSEKMGVYMGIFNFFIVIPQLLAASVLGFLLKTFFGNAPINALLIGGVSLLIAAVCTLRVKEPYRMRVGDSG